MKRLITTLAAALVATVLAAPVWGTSQNTQGQAKIWLEYKGPQVLDACDPGMPSTHSAVNVEAWGGFFEPGIDSGLKQARVAVSPHDVLEIAFNSPDNWAAIPSNGQIRFSLRKGDSIIYFRQKASSYAPMPSSERRTVRVSLLTSCSDCRGAPGGTPITSGRTVFGEPFNNADFDTYEVDEGQSCHSPDHAGPTFSHMVITGCRVRVQAPGAETYTWENCSTKFAGTGDNKYCYTVPNRRSDPVCDTAAKYTCEPPKNISNPMARNNTQHYRVVNNPRAIFEVQYNGYGCD